MMPTIGSIIGDRPNASSAPTSPAPGSQQSARRSRLLDRSYREHDLDLGRSGVESQKYALHQSVVTRAAAASNRASAADARRAAALSDRLDSMMGTVVSLPMLLDRNVDFVTAMIASLEVVLLVLMLLRISRNLGSDFA